MINCLTSFQKLLSALWAATGFGIVIAICATERAALGIMAPDTVANGLGSIGGVTAVIVIALYVGISMTQCDDFEFLNKLWHIVLASFFNSRRSERKVYVWMAEKQIIESWDDYSARTGRAANFENICTYLSSEYDIEMDMLEEWQANGAARKTLTGAQVIKILKGIAQKVDFA